MLNPLTWIRSAVRDAVMAGFGDALAELDTSDAASAAAGLRQRLAAPPALTPALNQPEGLPAAADVAEANGNGRRNRKASTSTG